MKERRSYYRILQIQPDAPPEIIQASYRALMKELRRHPDLGGSTEEAFVLNEAYEILMDPEKRTAYDDRIFHKSINGGPRFTRRDTSTIICPVCAAKVLRQPKPGEFCRNCRTPLCSDLEVETDDENRRAISRIKSSTTIEYYTTWPGALQQGRMLDFSPKGMRFLCEEELSTGTVLKISCPLLEAAGTVTNLSHETPTEHLSYAVGIYFIAVHFTDVHGTFLSTFA